MPTDFFASPEFLGLLRFWDESREGAALPVWHGDVSVVPEMLRPHVIIAEGWPDTVYRYVGAECVRRWGSDTNGRPVFEVLTGDYGRYVRSLAGEVLVQRAPIYSASIFHTENDDLLMTGRLYAPMLSPGAEAPSNFITVQLFGAAMVPLATVGSSGFVEELDRRMIAAVPQLCARLEEARRYHLLARRAHQRDIVRDMAAIAAELTGDALVKLPTFSASR